MKNVTGSPNVTSTHNTKIVMTHHSDIRYCTDATTHTEAATTIWKHISFFQQFNLMIITTELEFCSVLC